MSDECYIVASVHGVYMYPTSKPYLSKNGVINQYKKQVEITGDKNLKILKAQWVNADFDQYLQLKTLIESERDSDEL